MKDFFMRNWPTLSVVTGFVVYMTILAFFKKWDRIRSIAYGLMLKAERTIKGTKRGKERFEYVFQKIYSLMPFWLQFFYPPGDMQKKLQEWFDIAKDGLDDGKLNNSV